MINSKISAWGTAVAPTFIVAFSTDVGAGVVVDEQPTKMRDSATKEIRNKVAIRLFTLNI
ncbi:MAG: hypothetical protein WCR27_08220 [Eubacteriales bacterium]